MSPFLANPVRGTTRWPSVLLPVLTIGCVLLAALCVSLAYKLHMVQSSTAFDWPLNAVFSPQEVTPVVVGDANLGISDMLAGKQSSLPQYLSNPASTLAFPLPDPSGHIAKMLSYVKASNLTSYADAFVVATLSSLATEQKSRIKVRLCTRGATSRLRRRQLHPVRKLCL